MMNAKLIFLFLLIALPQFLLFGQSYIHYPSYIEDSLFFEELDSIGLSIDNKNQYYAEKTEIINDSIMNIGEFTFSMSKYNGNIFDIGISNEIDLTMWVFYFDENGFMIALYYFCMRKEKSNSNKTLVRTQSRYRFAESTIATKEDVKKSFINLISGKFTPCFINSDSYEGDIYMIPLYHLDEYRKIGYYLYNNWQKYCSEKK